MTHQVALTITGSVVPDRLPELERVVATMAKDPGHNPVVPFADLPATHFARVVILAPGSGGTAVPTLLMTLDCDASVLERLDDLVEVAGTGLDELFGVCADYPPAPDASSRTAFLRSHLQDSQVFYAARGRSHAGTGA